MNKVNHKPTQDIICDVILRIKKQVSEAEAFRQKKIALETDTRMSREYQETQLSELRQSYIAGLNETKTYIIESLGKIAGIEEENEKILDFELPEFPQALASIDAVRGKLPDKIIFSIRDKFKGNHQSLLIIASALKFYGIDIEKYNFKDYITPATSKITELITDAENIEQSEVSSFISLRELLHNIVNFGECRGMIFGDDFKNLDSELEEIAKDLTARREMGLQID